MILILIAIAVAVIAWMVIPKQPRGPNPPEAGPPPVVAWPIPTPFGPTGPFQASVGTTGPFQASVEEKMAVIATELRKRQTDRYCNEVLDEVAELVTAKTEEQRTKNK